MENWFYKNKFFEKLLIFTWIIFLIFCIGLLSFTSNAATPTNTGLPFHESYINDYQSYFYNYTASLTTIKNYYDVDQYDNCAIIVYENSQNSTYYYLNTILLTDENISNLVPYNGSYQSISLTNFTDFTSDYFIYNGSIRGKVWRIRKNNLATFASGSSTLTTLSNVSILGNHSMNDLGLTYCYPIYIKGTLSLNISGTVTQVPIFTDYTINGTPIPTGHATEPGEFDSPELATGSNYTLPREVPETPTINNYTWVTYNPPSIDTTNLESLVESFIYVVNYLAGWLKDNLSGEFQNLISNLKDLIGFIVQTIQYYGGLIIDAFKTLTTFLYNNFVSLIEKIAEGVSYLVQPVNGEIIYDNISETSLNTNFELVKDSIEDFQGTFTNLSEPETFLIPIHLENLPASYFGVQTTQYIDVGVINPVKSILRGFLWAIITYSLFITIVDSIANYINGGGDES